MGFKTRRLIGIRDWGRNALQIRQGTFHVRQSLAGGSVVRWPELFTAMLPRVPRLARALLRATDIFYFDLAQTVVVEAERLRCFRRHIDDAAADKRPAIIDAHDNRALIAEIGHPHIARQRQRRVRCRKRVHVECLAIGGSPPVKVFAVPGGHADGCIAGRLFCDHLFHGMFARNFHGAFADNALALRRYLAGCGDSRRGGSVLAISAACDIVVGRAVRKHERSDAQYEQARDLFAVGISPDFHETPPLRNGRRAAPDPRR